MKTRRIAMDAMLIALHFLLSVMLSLNLGNMKLTFDALPILIAALLFGPADGLLVGLMGAFFAQLYQYGLTPTTILWCLPAMLRGLFVGGVAKWKRYELSPWQLLFVIVVSSLLVTTLNTVVMAIDALLYHYYSRAYVFGALLMRYSTGMVTALLYSIVTPPLLHQLKLAGVAHGARNA